LHGLENVATAAGRAHLEGRDDRACLGLEREARWARTAVLRARRTALAGFARAVSASRAARTAVAGTCRARLGAIATAVTASTVVDCPFFDGGRRIVKRRRR